MASTNKTSNYDLSQFIETDKPGWLTDYNSDMRKIDSNLKSVSDEASGASADLSALTDRVSTAEGAITQNTNNITSLDARTDSLEAQEQASAGAITNLQTEQTTQNLGIEAATKLGYNIARPYDAASTYAVGDYVLFQNTLYKCVTAIPVGEEFTPAKWLAIKVTDEIGAYINMYSDDMTNPLYDTILSLEKIPLDGSTPTNTDLTITAARQSLHLYICGKIVIATFNFNYDVTGMSGIPAPSSILNFNLNITPHNENQYYNNIIKLRDMEVFEWNAYSGVWYPGTTSFTNSNGSFTVHFMGLSTSTTSTKRITFKFQAIGRLK